MKLAVFDLDYTIWQPEMYQLYGRPTLVPIGALKSKPSTAILDEMKTKEDGKILVDSQGSPMRVFPGASKALAEINAWKHEGRDVQAAIASCTDEPSWARICLDNLIIEDNTVLGACIPEKFREIRKGSKAKHLELLHFKTGVAYEDMAFFDNERWNIKDVSAALPDVKCFYTPNGMTHEAWHEAKAEFGMESQN